MWNEPPTDQLASVPKLYATENTPLEDKLIYLHFFICGCDWYIAEFDGEEIKIISMPNGATSPLMSSKPLKSKVFLKLIVK